MRGGGIKKESGYVLLDRRSSSRGPVGHEGVQGPRGQVGASDEAHGADGAPTTRDQQ